MNEITIKIRTFFSAYPVMSYKKDEIILRPDDPTPYVFYIVSGFVRMYCLLPDGKELTLNIFKQGSYFPMFLILGNSTNTYYYETLTPVKLERAPKGEVLTFLHRESDVLFEFTSRISVGLNGLLSNIQYVLFGLASSRVASVLLILARRFGEAKNSYITIQLPLTHQDIANLIGLTRETTSLEMEKLVTRKIISYDHKQIIIRNIQVLAQEVAFEGASAVDDASL
jgi:CRP/FNR family transcriptional regulator, anaerobic regulatory protein